MCLLAFSSEKVKGAKPEQRLILFAPEEVLIYVIRDFIFHILPFAQLFIKGDTTVAFQCLHGLSRFRFHFLEMWLRSINRVINERTSIVVLFPKLCLHLSERCFYPCHAFHIRVNRIKASPFDVSQFLPTRFHLFISHLSSALGDHLA